MDSKTTKRASCPNLVFHPYLSVPDRPVIAVQLEQAESVEHPYASDGRFAAVPGSWRITYGTRSDGNLDIAICQNDVFQLTYDYLGGSKYQKKPTIVTRAARIDVPLDILTTEGPAHGEPGDWLLVGVNDDLHLCDNDTFVARYVLHH